MIDYKILKADYGLPENMESLISLQNTVYEGKHEFSENTFRFWYLDNPDGHVLSFNAWKDNILAAHYAVIPTRMVIDGRVVRGCLSMATVTHPNHRGKGLFKTLAKETYEYAKEIGYEFIIGVANDNSYPGFIKYFPFEDVGALDVLVGLRPGIQPDGEKLFSTYWDEQRLAWRVGKPKYFHDEGTIYGTIGALKMNRFPFVKTLMGIVPETTIPSQSLRHKSGMSRPLTLYVGMGSNAKKLGYRPAPAFLHRSKFHLIFMDLTDGKLPKMTKDNVFFQLMDFDVS